MKKAVLAVTLLLCLPVIAQSPVEKAQIKLHEEHEAALISKAKELLTEKQLIEERLTEINSKLEKLDHGVDVKIGNVLRENETCAGCIAFTGGTAVVCPR